MAARFIPRLSWRSLTCSSSLTTLSAAFWSAAFWSASSDSDAKDTVDLAQPKFGFKEKELGQLPSESVSLPSSDLSHSFLVKQASLLAAESCIVLLNRSVATYLDITQDHLSELEKLTGMYSMQNDNLPTLLTNQEMYNEMVVLKLKVKEEAARISELHLVLDYTTRLAETAVETAFLVGNQELATTSSEHLHKLMSVIQERKLRLEAARLEVRRSEASHIESTSQSNKDDTSSKESASKPSINHGAMKKLVDGLKKFDSMSADDQIKLSRHKEESEESEKFRFRFQDNSDDGIKISVKEPDEGSPDAEKHSSEDQQPGDNNNDDDELLEERTDVDIPEDQSQNEESFHQYEPKTYKMPTF